MGTNAVVKLPAGTRMGDVANVVGILLGCEKEWFESGNARWIRVKRVEEKCSQSIPELAYIDIDLTGLDNPVAVAIRESDGDTYEMSYHFEGGHGGPSINPKATAAKIALCKAVVQFFGGEANYNDCDSVDINVQVDGRNPIAPSDGKPWDDFQQALDNLKPLTANNMKAVGRWAAY